jgi:dihydrofolate reductase
VTAAKASPAAGRVVVDISMSLDGYVTAPGADRKHGLGVGGGALHAWASTDSETMDAAVARTGAVIMGRRTFDFIDGPHGWGQEVADSMSRQPGMPPPIFVVTHAKPETVRLKGFTFVADLRQAVDEAHAAAGGKDVVIMGGGAISHAFLEAGLVDALVLHVAPIILGDGTPLFPPGPSASFRLEREEAQCTPAATHLTYRVLPS